MESWLVVVLSGIGGGLFVFLLGFLLPDKKCPECGEPLPKFRKPVNL